MVIEREMPLISLWTLMLLSIYLLVDDSLLQWWDFGEDTGHWDGLWECIASSRFLTLSVSCVWLRGDLSASCYQVFPIGMDIEPLEQ